MKFASEAFITFGSGGPGKIYKITNIHHFLLVIIDGLLYRKMISFLTYVKTTEVQKLEVLLCFTKTTLIG
jgi:hypothetical protein